MRNNPRKKSIILGWYIVFCCVSFVYPKLLSAAGNFNLTYSLTEGGFRLELTNQNSVKGLELSVTSSASERYEVLQRLVAPLQNRENPSITLRDNFVFRGLRGTNRHGDFRVPVTDTPLRSEQIIYVSDSSGNSDSFTLAYSIVNPQDIEPGHYFGRIAFVLNPINSSQPAVTQILDVYVTIDRKFTDAEAIKISTPSGTSKIILNPRTEDDRNTQAIFKINAKFRNKFSIEQFLARPLTSEEGTKLDGAVVEFAVQGASKGVATNIPTGLSAGMQEIYSSRPNGDADNEFTVTYSLGDLSGQKSGRYTSQINYLLLDAGGTQSRLESLDLEVENARIFDLKIKPLDQRYAIEFQNVKPTEPPRSSEVEIEVLSNIGRQYQLTQEAYSQLTNKEGDLVPDEYFTLRTQSINTKGSLKIPEKQVVGKGSKVLFISDAFGSSDKLKVIYQLESPKDLKAGDYSTRITYSLSEI